VKRTGAGAMRLCILGGSTREPGGVESFCERALEAVRAHWHGDAMWVPTDTAYMRITRIPRLIRGLRAFRRGHRTRFDVVWLNVSNLPDLLYLFAAKALGIPVLVTLHLGANSRLQRHPLLRRACRGLLRRADRVALLFEGQDAEIALPDSVPRSTIRTFLPRESFLPRPPHDPGDAVLHLIHAGRLSEGKGSLLMVDLCAALERAGTPFTASIVGRGDAATMQELDARIAAAGLQHRIVLSDWLAGPALLDALRHADLLVHLSRLDSFPLTVLEAMASGTVPLAIDMAGVRVMTAAYGGHLVDPDAAVTEAAAWISAQPLDALRRAGAEMGERVRRDYDWPACVDLLDAAIDAMPQPRERR
jgi:glycosyltransferase involved in cell wall biosynthesis